MSRVSPLYSPKEISRLAGISESQIRYWDRKEVIAPVERQGGKPLFDFRALVAFRAVKCLLGEGVPLRRIRQAIEKLKRVLPDVSQPLAELHVALEGEEIVFVRDRLKFTPRGQLVIDFSAGNEMASVVPLTVDDTEALFFEALECEETDAKEAERKYEAVLVRRPGHPDALVNLGNIRLASGDGGQAERLYRKALEEDPDHLEANYNLANVLESRGDSDGAISLYRKAVREDPDFADAHFNLAATLDAAGYTTAAVKHWRRYLDLEPVGEWADHARRRLKGGGLPFGMP